MNYRATLTRLLRAAMLLLITLAAVADGRSATAQGAVLGPHTWQIQVDNVSPEGHIWSFNAFYPSQLQAHAGDTIVLRVAQNPNAMHLPVFLHAGFLPQQAYSGFVFPAPYLPTGEPLTFFQNTPNFANPPRPPCGRPDQSPCAWAASRPFYTAMLIVPPPGSGGAGNPLFTFTIGPDVGPGSYFFLCSVHAPGMSGRLDVLPPEAPVQSDAALANDVRRAYEGDLLRLTQAARTITPPSFSVNRNDGLKSYRIAVGGGPETRLAVNEFGTRTLFINPGDTVTWEVGSPQGVFHAISGFDEHPNWAVKRVEVFNPACEAPSDDTFPVVAPPRSTGRTPPPFQNGVTTVATADDEFSFDPDLWNTCQGRELALLGPGAIASPRSGTEYRDGAVTSGILLSQAFLDGLFGAGLPYSSSYTLRFMEPGSYYYICVIHDGMDGWITVHPRGAAPGEPGLP